MIEPRYKTLGKSNPEAPPPAPDPAAYWESMYTDLLLRADATLRERDSLALQVLVLEQQRDEARALGRIA